MMRASAVTSCALCGSDRSESVFSGPDRLLGFPGQFFFVRCLDCGLVRQDPRPTGTLDAYYPESYPPYAQSAGAKGGWLQHIDRGYGQHKRAAIVQRFCRTGRLLDIGCATGDFLLEMRQRRGWSVIGIEPNEYACQYARGLDLDVVCGTLEQAAFEDETFDIVTMWNVLEHVSDPLAELQRIWRILRPDGFVVFAVPVLESQLRKWFGPYWVEWDLPRHIHIFSFETIDGLLFKSGFRVAGTYMPFSEFRAFHMSIMHWAAGNLRRPFLRKGLDAFLRFIPVRVVLMVFLQIFTSRRSASIAVFVGRKA